MGAGKANVYENIVNELKCLIELGALKQGERLPSVRLYAVEHRVNPNTVAKAYATLEADGYLRVQPKQGAYVCYSGEGQTTGKKDEIKEQFSVWKEAGVSKDKLQETLVLVYGGEEL